MVMKASPTSSLEVPEPELLLEFLVVPLDAPAQLRERDEAVEVDVFRNGRKPELRGFCPPQLAIRPGAIPHPEERFERSPGARRGYGRARSERSGRRLFPRARRSSPRPRPEANA